MVMKWFAMKFGLDEGIMVANKFQLLPMDGNTQFFFQFPEGGREVILPSSNMPGRGYIIAARKTIFMVGTFLQQYIITAFFCSARAYNPYMGGAMPVSIQMNDGALPDASCRISMAVNDVQQL